MRRVTLDCCAIAVADMQADQRPAGRLARNAVTAALAEATGLRAEKKSQQIGDPRDAVIDTAIEDHCLDRADRGPRLIWATALLWDGRERWAGAAEEACRWVPGLDLRA